LGKYRKGKKAAVEKKSGIRQSIVGENREKRETPNNRGGEG